MTAATGSGPAPGWWAAAVCAHTDPEMFFPARGGSSEAAERVCAGCPVRQQCLEEALGEPWLVGVWGGTTARERGRLRRDRWHDPAGCRRCAVRADRDAGASVADLAAALGTTGDALRAHWSRAGLTRAGRECAA